MMNYEVFKNVVSEKIKDYLPVQYMDCEVLVKPVEKVNRALDGLMLVNPEKKAWASPTIYVNDLYESYMETENLKEVLNGAADLLVEYMDKAPEVQGHLQPEKAGEQIVFQLINTEQNREFLENMPHRPFQDLSVIYRWVVDNGPKGMESIAVDNRFAERFGFSEEQLFQLAMENTKRMFPPVVMNMFDVICEMMKRDGMPSDMIDCVLSDAVPDREMFVITNPRRINGASAIMYEDKLHELAMETGTDLYIMPSSIHECIAVPSTMADPEELAEMVVTVNMEQVELGDRLSNQVYFYDKDLRKLSLATDTPNKRLDQIAAESRKEALQTMRAR